MASFKLSDIKQVTVFEYNGKRYKTLESLAEQLAMQAGYKHYLDKLDVSIDEYNSWDSTQDELTSLRAKIVVYKKRVKPLILKKLKERFANESTSNIRKDSNG